jgi:serine/threonine protein phosphatase PrpC
LLLIPFLFLGDNYLQPHVTFRPDVYVVEFDSNDKLIVIGCDGLWDVMSSEDAVRIALSFPTAAEAAAALVDIAYGLGSSIMIDITHNYEIQ